MLMGDNIERDENGFPKIEGVSFTRIAPGARAKAAPQEEPTVSLIGADSLPVRPINWLWRHWLAVGKVHILAGEPGVAKTTIALSIAAALSRGSRLPDGSSAPLGRSIIWSGEDDPEDTLAPRLIAAGADRSRVHFVGEVEDRGEHRTFDPATDMHGLARAIERLGDVRLLIVDPIVSAVQGDDHKNAATRRALQPLKDLAATTGVAIVGVSHFRKGGGGGSPLERVNGSIAFGALARVVWVAAKEQPKDDASEPARILARAKSNIGPEDGGFRYQVRQTVLHEHPGVEASAVDWLGAIEGSARDILAEAEAAHDDEAASAHQEAEAFLSDLLANGPVATKEVKRRATEAGHSWRTLVRAKGSLNVVARKEGMAGAWSWRFGVTDGCLTKTAEGAQADAKVLSEKRWASSGAVEHLREEASVTATDDDDPECAPIIASDRWEALARVHPTAAGEGRARALTPYGHALFSDMAAAGERGGYIARVLGISRQSAHQRLAFEALPARSESHD